MDKEAERIIIAVIIDAVLTIIQKVAKCRKIDTKKSRKVLDNVRILCYTVGFSERRAMDRLDSA